MNTYNKIKNYALIGAVAAISFAATSSNAQISLFPNYNPNNDNAGLFQVGNGQPYYRNGTAYFYDDNHVEQRYYSNNNRRFCPPGQRKKNNCRNWRYKHRNDRDNNGRWDNEHDNNRWNNDNRGHNNGRHD